MCFLQTKCPLSHWGRVTHICVSRLTITGSDNGLSPGRRQGIIWTNAGILLIGLSGTNFSENLIEILTFSFTKMRLKVSSAKWLPFCLGLNVLTTQEDNVKAMIAYQWSCLLMKMWQHFVGLMKMWQYFMCPLTIMTHRFPLTISGSPE